MKYLSLLAFALLAGCETTKPTDPPEYTKLSVTDAEGEPIAEWIAEGKVKKTEIGYDIHAVERHSGPPHPVTMTYPNGRDTTVVGPNITLRKIDKPEWLRKIDGE